jgi:general secretion pathway protein L
MAELGGMLPALLRNRQFSRERIVLTIGQGMAVLATERREGFVTLGHVGLTAGAGGRGMVQETLRRHAARRRFARSLLPICLRLPFSASLQVRMNLPRAAKHNLSEVIAFELDRYTPFRAEQVYFSHRPATGEATGERIATDVTVVTRTTVDAALATAADLGLRPDSIDVAGPTEGAAASGALQIENLAPTTRAAQGRTVRMLAALTAAMAVATVAIPAVRGESKMAQLNYAVAHLVQRAAAVAALQDQVAALRADEDFLVQRKHRNPSVSALLAEITEILPDTTWLTGITIAGHDVQLDGYSASASALVRLIEQSHQFRNTSFLAPVTQDPQVSKERFSIGTQAVEGGRS